jgi:hypothetical protein
MDELAIVKSALRISHDKFDIHELKPLIAAAKKQMIVSGINPKIVESSLNPLVIRAIVFYCRANFGMGANLGSHRDAERNERAFRSLVEHIALAGDDIFIKI